MPTDPAVNHYTDRLMISHDARRRRRGMRRWAKQIRGHMPERAAVWLGRARNG